MVPIKKAIANKNNYGGKRRPNQIKYLVIHYTGNDGDRDESNGRYFQNNIVGASAHFFVDGDSITQSVPDYHVAWSVGGNKYPGTKGGKWYGKCTNNNSISIELCDEVKNGRYDFSEATLKNAADLTRMLMQEYNIPVENVIRHYDVVRKICPAPFVNDEAAWKAFKGRLKEDDEVVEKKTFWVEGKPLNMNSILSDGTNFVKLREIADALGYKIEMKGKQIHLVKK